MKRILASVMTCAVIIGLLPAGASAEPDLWDGELTLGSLLGQATGPAPGAPPLEPLSLHEPRFYLTVSPLVAGPAVTTGEVEMHVGGSISGCYNFYSGKVRIGVDFEFALGIPLMTDTGSGADDLEGTWIGLSAGVPFRLGERICFYLRPGICIDILDYRKDGYTTGYWVDRVDDVGFGLTVTAGVDINMHDRFALGFFFNIRLLPVYHEVVEYWNGFYDGTSDGFLSIAAGARFIIKI
jgi:opacity protein-like surface antigen